MMKFLIVPKWYNETALNGFIRMSQEKSAYFADVLNRYLICFCKFGLSKQINHKNIIKTKLMKNLCRLNYMQFNAYLINTTRKFNVL